ncbi:hypothetical protein [Methylobacterium sp. J-090]|uniref:hypothetical protein n=1 Tax=Methylobacterium sp. J-090 TaxID=2836666 RepID=UPI001FB94185|nr:hypothetical protein [Methylobacterium sp. J-090]MCJ2081533.1 hypothetical protein [Methylobacterium sp. J-090]
MARGFVGFFSRSYTSDAADIASAALLPLVYDGQPAQTQRGTYSALVADNAGDVVQVA